MPPKPEYIHDLKRDVALLSERLDNLRVETTDLGRDGDALRADLLAIRNELSELRREMALTHQRLDDHLKRVDVWDARRWGLIAAIVIALLSAALSLVSGLIVLLARK